MNIPNGMDHNNYEQAACGGKDQAIDKRKAPDIDHLGYPQLPGPDQMTEMEQQRARDNR